MINNKLSIFLADDDEDDRDFFTLAINRSSIDFNLTTFTNAVQLLGYINDSPEILPDYIFLDVRMPGKDGLECLKDIRNSSRWSNLPVGLYSTSNNKHEVEVAFSLGANIFIKKPITLNALTGFINHTLGSDITKKPASLKEFLLFEN